MKKKNWWDDYNQYYVVDFHDLIGKTFERVWLEGDEAIHFEGVESYALFHRQDCCEKVYVESIEGGLCDLVDAKILSATESSSNRDAKDRDESHTWTFYKLATFKGYVDIRFYGSSNGYYGESASLVKKTRQLTDDEIAEKFLAGHEPTDAEVTAHANLTGNSFYGAREELRNNLYGGPVPSGYGSWGNYWKSH